MKYYFHFELKNGAIKAAVAYSVEQAIAELKLSIEDIATWDNVKSNLPVGVQHA